MITVGRLGAKENRYSLMEFLLLNEYLKLRQVSSDEAFSPAVWQEANIMNLIWGGKQEAAMLLHSTIYSFKGETTQSCVLRFQ